jgi:hypothetical protein
VNRRRALLVAAGGAFVALAVTTIAGTYALFSDFDAVPGNRVAAASVELGPGASDDLALSYPPLVEGVVAEGELTVDYRGTVAADVTLSLDPGRATEFCRRGPDGWHNTFGISLVVTIGAQRPVNYCSLLDSGPVTLRAAVAPGTAPFTTGVDLTLTENELVGEAPITAVDALVVEASGGFSDRAQGTLTAPVEPIPAATPEQEEVSATPPGLDDALRAASVDPRAVLAPDFVPVECRGTTFRPDQVVQLEPGDSPWSAVVSRGEDLRPEPLLIFGTPLADEITGSDAGDCIVGGDGDDRIAGGDGDDVLIGDQGADTLDGGLGDDALYGGPGFDRLSGGEGTDAFDGGADRAICDDGPSGPGAGPGCDPPAVTTVPVPTTTTAPPITDERPAEVVPPTTTTEPPPPTDTTVPAAADAPGGDEAVTTQPVTPSAATSQARTEPVTTEASTTTAEV